MPKSMRVETLCDLPAEVLWSLKLDTEFEQFQADRRNGGFQVLEHTAINSIHERTTLLTFKENPIPPRFRSMLGASDFSFRVSSRWHEARHDEAHAMTFVSEPPVMPDRIKVSGGQWVEAVSPTQCRIIQKGTVAVNVFGLGGQVEAALIAQMQQNSGEMPRMAEEFVALKHSKNEAAAAAAAAAAAEAEAEAEVEVETETACQEDGDETGASSQAAAAAAATTTKIITATQTTPPSSPEVERAMAALMAEANDTEPSPTASSDESSASGSTTDGGHAGEDRAGVRAGVMAGRTPAQQQSPPAGAGAHAGVCADRPAPADGTEQPPPAAAASVSKEGEGSASRAWRLNHLAGRPRVSSAPPGGGVLSTRRLAAAVDAEVQCRQAAASATAAALVASQELAAGMSAAVTAELHLSILQKMVAAEQRAAAASGQQDPSGAIGADHAASHVRLSSTMALTATASKAAACLLAVEVARAHWRHAADEANLSSKRSALAVKTRRALAALAAKARATEESACVTEHAPEAAAAAAAAAAVL